MKQAKRRTFWFLLGVSTVITGQVLLAGITAAETPAAAPATQTGYITRETRTVWDLVIKTFPGEDPRRIISQIKRLNDGLDFGRVTIGQAIKMPAKEGQ